MEITILRQIVKFGGDVVEDNDAEILRHLTFQSLKSFCTAHIQPESSQLVLPDLLVCNGSLIFGQLLNEGVRLQKKQRK